MGKSIIFDGSGPKSARLPKKSFETSLLTCIVARLLAASVKWSASHAVLLIATSKKTESQSEADAGWPSSPFKYDAAHQSKEPVNFVRKVSWL